MKMLLNSLYSHRYILWSLAKNDFRNRYLGSFLGVLWAFLLPLVNLSIMWFAFQQGLKVTPTDGVPFILWLVTGMFPWAFFSEAVLNSSNSIVEKSFLVKKIQFQVEFLPIIKIIASFFPFLFLSAVMFILFMLYGYWPDIYWLQVPYYAFCLCAFILALSWLTSSVVVFYRDLGHIISVALQLGFWITPIFWTPERLPEKFRFVFFLNPIGYIVTGYRNSLISKVWFWQEPAQTVYFWVLIIGIGVFGLLVFKKLRPHFADVL
jgi:lipopolysaccharide transport system permease protein/teichoic acid transport system permease protein